jgi:hypothetical protein
MLLRALLLLVALGALVACGKKPGGKVMADTPVLPYLPPDPDEIAGVEVDDDDLDEDEGTAHAPAPAPTP